LKKDTGLFVSGYHGAKVVGVRLAAPGRA